MKGLNKLAVPVVSPIENETLKQEGYIRNTPQNGSETKYHESLQNKGLNETDDEIFFKAFIKTLETKEVREEFFERVSICYYEGNLSIELSRKTALEYILKKVKSF